MTNNNVLVINSGSSSVKYQLLDVVTQHIHAQGLIGKIGEVEGQVEHISPNFIEIHSQPVIDHHSALALAIDLISRSGYDLVANPPEVVGHRVVHGGPDLWNPVLIDHDVVEKIKQAYNLAPLHNPAHVKGIEVMLDLLPQAPQVAVFDTGFFQYLPSEAAFYALNADIAEKYSIRRYGAHGTSHQYVSEQAAAFLGKDNSSLNQIVFHLGNGASVSAIKGGKPIDTSMGLTPLEGLVMGTRTGDIDPSVYSYLNRSADLSPSEVDNILNKRSGLKGLTGTNDFREVIERAELGDEKAAVALGIYTHRLKKYLGAYWAILHSVDVISFTAGIGENSSWIRQALFQDFETWGIRIDKTRNEQREKGIRVISSDDSAITVLVVPTKEELAIAQAAASLVNKVS